MQMLDQSTSQLGTTETDGQSCKHYGKSWDWKLKIERNDKRKCGYNEHGKCIQNSKLNFFFRHKKVNDNFVTTREIIF
jgi:hypothetical protein